MQFKEKKLREAEEYKKRNESYALKVSKRFIFIVFITPCFYFLFPVDLSEATHEQQKKGRKLDIHNTNINSPSRLETIHFTRTRTTDF